MDLTPTFNPSQKRSVTGTPSSELWNGFRGPTKTVFTLNSSLLNGIVTKRIPQMFDHNTRYSTQLGSRLVSPWPRSLSSNCFSSIPRERERNAISTGQSAASTRMLVGRMRLIVRSFEDSRIGGISSTMRLQTHTGMDQRRRGTGSSSMAKCSERCLGARRDGTLFDRVSRCCGCWNEQLLILMHTRCWLLDKKEPGLLSTTPYASERPE